MPDTPAPAIDLEHYSPAYFTFIANKLARGASAHYLATYGVGPGSRWRRPGEIRTALLTATTASG